jgi:hypothetical protein
MHEALGSIASTEKKILKRERIERKKRFVSSFREGNLFYLLF